MSCVPAIWTGSVRNSSACGLRAGTSIFGLGVEYLAGVGGLAARGWEVPRKIAEDDAQQQHDGAGDREQWR